MNQTHEAGRVQRLKDRVRRLRRWRETDAGQTLVEFSLILPIMLIMLFALVDFGRAFYTWIVVTNAAREGARTGAVQQPVDAIKTQVVKTASGLDSTKLTITVVNAQGTRGQTVKVDVTYNFSYVTPLKALMAMGGQSLSTPTISSSSSMRLE